MNAVAVQRTERSEAVSSETMQQRFSWLLNVHRYLLYFPFALVMYLGPRCITNSDNNCPLCTWSMPFRVYSW